MIIVKVYGAFHPADESCFAAIAKAGRDAVGQVEPWLFFENGLIRIAFEGLYFPAEEVLEALKSALPEEAQGRLDYLDLEAWTLTRHVLRPGGDFIAPATRSLNHVLDHAGH